MFVVCPLRIILLTWIAFDFWACFKSEVKRRKSQKTIGIMILILQRKLKRPPADGTAKQGKTVIFQNYSNFF